MRQLSLPLDGSLDEAERRQAKDGQSVVVRLASESIEAIALRLAELLSGGASSDRWIDANEVARRHGVSRAFVYEHADELGAIRVGAGPRPRLRFDPSAVEERLADASTLQPRMNGRGAPLSATPRKRGLARHADDRLLPIGPRRRANPSVRDQAPSPGGRSAA